MYSVLIVLSTLATITLSLSYYECGEPCRGEDCNNIPKEDCNYGVTRDVCGRLACKSGPGSQCGGRENHLGKCGEGMNCICGKCRGCSIDRLMSGIIECDYTNPICT